MLYINNAIYILKWYALVAVANDTEGGDGKRALTKRNFY